MSEYTKKLSAKQLIKFIATDYIELSQDKIRAQRDEYIKICREWLEKGLDTVEITDDEIAIIWSVEDVKTHCPWLSDDDAYEVLCRLDHKHDASIGINWDIIGFTAELMFGEKYDGVDKSNW